MSLLSRLLFAFLFLCVVKAYSHSYSREAFYSPEFHLTNKYETYDEFFDESNLAPKTKCIQKWIFSKQNPTDCLNANYLITKGFNAGLGAELIAIASHLTYALEKKMILIWDRHSQSKYLNSSQCHGQGFACIFQPLSHCESQISDEEYNSIHQYAHDIHHTFWIPKQVEKNMFKHMPLLTHAQALYWWKAQSLAYVFRLNSAALREINEMRKSYDNLIYSEFGVQIPFPLPSSAIHMHIRRGDKVVKEGEMEFLPTDEYVNACKKLIASHPMSFVQKIVYVTSDDKRVIEEVKEKLVNENYKVLHSMVNTMKNGYFFKNLNGFSQNMTRSTLELIMELFVTLEADAWIGTRMSCWGRLTDQLRCVWIDKCKNQYVEVGDLKNHGDEHMYHEFVAPQHARKYGKQKIIWEAPNSLFPKA